MIDIVLFMLLSATELTKNILNGLGLIKENNSALSVLRTCISEDSSLWKEIEVLEKAVYKMKNKWKLEAIFKGTKQVGVVFSPNMLWFWLNF